MSSFSVFVRRLLWLVAIGLAGGAALKWWRDHELPAEPDAPEWPPIEVPDTPSSPAVDPSDEVTDIDDPADEPAEAPAEEPVEPPADTSDEIEPGTPSIVNALVDAPEARSVAGDDGAWVAPEDDGSCPLSHPIKANDNSGIFHVPGGRFYDRTKAERCYADADAAAADGYRRAKS